MVEALTFVQNLGLISSGIIIGGILGAVFSYSGDDNRKGKTIWAFVALLIAGIGGGLYFFSDQIEVFYTFTIPYGVGFAVIGLIAKKFYKDRYGYKSSRVV